MIELKESGVIFDQENHTYTLNGVELSGITGMISRQLFPDKYTSVPEPILKAAAERGSLIHEACELVDELDVQNDLPEVQGYARLKAQYNLSHIRSEYIVTDREHFASGIDKVYAYEDGVMLGDVKTTYKLDKEYVKWQLSIYAHLFEMQNPGVPVRKLVAIWLRNDNAELVEVDRLPASEVIDLMACEVSGTQYRKHPVKLTGDLPAEYRKMEDAIVTLVEQIDMLEQQKKSFTERMLDLMTDNNVTKWQGDRVTFTRKAGGERESFDTKRFKEKHPELYREFITKKEFNQSLMIKIR